MDERHASMVDRSRALEHPGPLTRKVLEFEQTIKRLLPVVDSPDDWAPLASLVAVDEFERVGTFLEVQDWQQYTEMLTRWGTSIEKFETTVRRVSELPGLVYFEIEERHFRATRSASSTR